MKNTFIATAVAAIAATSAAAETSVEALSPVTPLVSGELALDLGKTAAGDMAGTMDIDLGIDAAGLATIDLDFAASGGSSFNDATLKLEDWTVGTTVGNVDLAFGTDNSVMPEAEGEQTLAVPTMTESFAATTGATAVAVGFTDWGTNITDISNVQGAYAFSAAGLDVTAAADYNLDTENTVLGAEIGGYNLGLAALSGAMTYDVDAEAFGFETVATAGDVTAYANGDDTDVLQNIGGEYEMAVGGATFSAGANYNIDTEDFAPTAGLTFNF